MTHDQHLTQRADSEAEQVLAALSAEEQQRLLEAGGKRQSAIRATPAGTYRSLRAIENGGTDKVEYTDRPR